MSLNDHKIDVRQDDTVNGKGVVTAPDRLTGNARDNKKLFDELVREVVSACLNGLIDALAATGATPGAGEIGAAVPDGLSEETAPNVQAILEALKDYADTMTAGDISATPPTGMSATTVQGILDTIFECGAQYIKATDPTGITMMTVQAFLNSINEELTKKAAIATLAASGGAATIGATTPNGLTGATVQALLNSIAAKLAEKAAIATLAATGGAATVGANDPTEFEGNTVQQVLESLKRDLDIKSGELSDLVENLTAGDIAATAPSGLSGRTVQALLVALKSALDTESARLGGLISGLTAGDIAATAPEGLSGANVQALLSSLNDRLNSLIENVDAEGVWATAPAGLSGETVQELINSIAGKLAEKASISMLATGDGAEMIGALKPDGETRTTVQLLLDTIANKLAAQIVTEQIADGAVTPAKLNLPTLKNGYAVQSSGDYSHAEGENHANQWFTEITKEAVQIDGKYYLNVTPTTVGIYSYNIDGFLLYLNAAISGNISKDAGYYFYFREDFDNDYIIETGTTLMIDPQKLIAAKVVSSTPTPYNFNFDTDAIVFGAVAASVASHCEGFSTSAFNTYSHSEGYRTVAAGHGSHAEGFHTIAIGRGSHAEGVYGRAKDVYSHAEGARTVAKGKGSHAEGYKTEAVGAYSHAEGIGTKAAAAHQHVSGEYNADNSDALLIVGNGADESHRSNAFEVLRNGAVRVGSVDLLKVIYNSYPVEEQVNQTVLSTDIAADDLKMERLIVDFNGRDVLHRLRLIQTGKNFFGKAPEDLPEEKPYYWTAGNSRLNNFFGYTVILPPGTYTISAEKKSGSDPYNCAMYIALNSGTESHSYVDSGTIYDYRSSQAQGPLTFTVATNNYRLYVCVRYTSNYETAVDFLETMNVMIERGEAATSFEAYSGRAYDIDIPASAGLVVSGSLNVLTGELKRTREIPGTCMIDAIEVRTKYGCNNVFLEPDNLIGSEVVDAAYHLDPTLAYNELKTAIIATRTT